MTSETGLASWTALVNSSSSAFSMRQSLSNLRSSLILMVVSSMGFILIFGKELAILRELALGDLG